MPVPDPTAFFDTAFAALAHPGRRAILHLLADSGPLRAAQIACEFSRVTPGAVRQHLCRLRRAGLVQSRQCGPIHDQGLHGAAVAFALQGRLPDGRDVWYSLSEVAVDVLRAELLDLHASIKLYPPSAV
jgi:DNA-binding transcriptional ArsR family regulator